MESDIILYQNLVPLHTLSDVVRIDDMPVEDQREIYPKSGRNLDDYIHLLRQPRFVDFYKAWSEIFFFFLSLGLLAYGAFMNEMDMHKTQWCAVFLVNSVTHLMGIFYFLWRWVDKEKYSFMFVARFIAFLTSISLIASFESPVFFLPLSVLCLLLTYFKKSEVVLGASLSFVWIFVFFNHWYLAVCALGVVCTYKVSELAQVFSRNALLLITSVLVLERWIHTTR